jgi:hypothetical protein
MHALVPLRLGVGLCGRFLCRQPPLPSIGARHTECSYNELGRAHALTVVSFGLDAAKQQTLTSMLAGMA